MSRVIVHTSLTELIGLAILGLVVLVIGGAFAVDTFRSWRARRRR
ncbi:MAG: hypothetical protein AAB262_07120 [Elusimicrobiota bacterium]